MSFVREAKSAAPPVFFLGPSNPGLRPPQPGSAMPPPPASSPLTPAYATPQPQLVPVQAIPATSAMTPHPGASPAFLVQAQAPYQYQRF